MADDIDPDPRSSVQSASALLDAGDPNAARSRLEAGAREHGWTIEGRYLLARVAALSGDDDQAIGLAREVTADPVYRADANLLLVSLLSDAGDVEGARIAADAVLDDRPEWVPGLLARAHVAGREGAHEDELALIDRARMLAPDDPVVRTTYGVALLDRGSRAEGQRELAAVVGTSGHPFAASELVGSAIRSSRARRWLFLVFTGVPILLVLIALAVQALTDSSFPWIGSLYFYSLLAIVVTVRTIERARTDSSVRLIKKDARRRLMRGGPRAPDLASSSMAPGGLVRRSVVPVPRGRGDVQHGVDRTARWCPPVVDPWWPRDRGVTAVVEATSPTAQQRGATEVRPGGLPVPSDLAPR
jgi:hypothetical protein